MRHLLWHVLWPALLTVVAECVPFDIPMKHEFKTLNGNWDVLKETPVVTEPFIPLVACGGQADKDHGVLRGKVLSARTGRPLRGVKISYSHSRGRCETITDRFGEYSITAEVWQSQNGSGERKITYSKLRYEAAFAFYRVVLGKSKWVPTFVLPLRYFKGSARGEVRGVARSSSTGHRITKSCPCNVCVKPVAKVRRGANAVATPLLSQVRIFNGEFRIPGLIPGVYTLELQIQCFVPRLTTIVVQSGKITHLTKRVFLVPAFIMTEQPRLRFLLTWAAHPADLNLHLLVPQDGRAKPTRAWTEISAHQSINHESNYEHRMYNSKHLLVHYNGSGSKDIEPYSELIINASHGYGPEEIVVQKPLSGRYMLYVRKIGQAFPLEQTEATVDVFKNNKLLETIQIHSHGASLTKRTWNVLSFMGDSLQLDLDGFDHFTYKVENYIEHREPPKQAFD